MSGNITWEMILGLTTLAGFIIGVWRILEGKIKNAQETATLVGLAAQAKAETAQTELNSYKLHVAETYATREGVDRGFQAVSQSVDALGARMEKRLDGVNERLDRVIEVGKTHTRNS